MAKTDSSLDRLDQGGVPSKSMTRMSSQDEIPYDTGKAPDGGARAWLVALGAAFVFFSGLGFANSFGVFQEYYMTHQLRDKSPDDIAWIGSLAAFLQFLAGAIGGPLFDRYGDWVCFTQPLPLSHFTDRILGYQARCGVVCLLPHDDEFVFEILAAHAHSRRLDGHLHGTSHVSSYGSSFAIL